MSQIFIVIAPLFLIIFASALLQRFTKIGDGWSAVLNELALKIGFPVLIFSALAKTSVSLSEHAPLLISNSVFILGIFLLAYAVGRFLRLDKQMLRTLFVCLIFGNVAYLGIPTLVQISGEGVLPAASLIVAVYLFWIFTVGVGFLDFTRPDAQKNVFKKLLTGLFKNPLLIAVVLGVAAANLKIVLPSVIMSSLDMIAASVTPTVLIVIGLFIGKSKIGRPLEWLPALLFSLATLLVLPALFYFGLKFLGFSPSQFSFSIIQAAMPLAITPFALAEKYDLRKEFIARSIVLSTILSILSLPFWISMLY